MLSSTYQNGELVPMLVVGDTLPAAVRDFLAATPQADSEGDKVNLTIVAIGGGAAVSDSVMSAALDAAASSDDLTLKIAAAGGDLDEDGDDTDDPPQATDTSVVLHFSDNVITDNATLTQMVRTTVPSMRCSKWGCRLMMTAVAEPPRTTT